MDFFDSLEEELLTEVATSFFDERRSVDSMVSTYHDYFQRLADRQGEVYLYAAKLEKVFLDAETTQHHFWCSCPFF